MAEGVQIIAPVGSASSALQASRGTQNLRASRRIARFLTTSVVLFAITTVGFAFWITREHNRLAASASEQMIRGGMTALEETLKTVSMDFAIWPAAVQALEQEDVDWIWLNFGISAAVTETTDLMMIVPAGGAPAYGWTPGMDAEPSTELMPGTIVSSMLKLLDDVPIADRRAVSSLARTQDETWLLTVARIVSDEPEKDPTDDTLIPRLIFGFHLTPDQMPELGEQYLIEDLSLSDTPPEGAVAIELLDSNGQLVSYAAWTAPRPGDQILRQISVPLTLALAILTLVALISSNLLSRSARRLETAMLSAQAASRAKSEFIANISHELRTPMNGVIGLAGLLNRSDLDTKQSKMVEMLLSSADTQMRLIDDLLDVSSIENGSFSLNVAPFSPSTVVETTCAMFEIEASNKGLELRVTRSDNDRIQVLGDRERFAQICSNLISNAIKFTDKGYVEVDLKVRTRLGEATVVLSVTDTGRGIAPEEQALIFERFAQSATRELGKAAGNGLGLAITRTIVDLMGGEIEVDSSLGNGSTFRVQLSFQEARAETARETALEQG